MQKLALLALVAATAATAAHAAAPAPSCASMALVRGTVTATVDQGCVSCAVGNPARAADGATATYATLGVVSAPTQGVALRATAKPGVTFPAGQTPGAFVSVPAGVGQAYSLGVRTYLGGALQEISNGVVVNGQPVQTSFGGATLATTGQGPTFQGFRAKKAFDAVEVFVSSFQATNPTATSVPLVTLGTPTFNVYEICSSGG